MLTVINGLAELALGELPQDSPLREHLGGIQAAGGRAAQLTRQLLAFSRKQVLHPTIVSLNALVREAESLLQRVLGDDVRVEVALANDLSPVRVDAGQLHQVILNLAMNGRDAMPKGGTLRIETRLHAVEEHHRSPHRLPPGRYAVLAMSDTGVGIDPETQQRLFEPFFTTKEPGKGTGLGLATVHGIVKQSGGEICVTSDVGRGTTFTIFLPMTDEPEQPAAEKMPATSRGAECILVVDDDAGVRTLTKRLLERAGYSVRTAADGPDALRVLEAHGLGDRSRSDRRCHARYERPRARGGGVDAFPGHARPVHVRLYGRCDRAARRPRSGDASPRQAVLGCRTHRQGPDRPRFVVVRDGLAPPLDSSWCS